MSAASSVRPRFPRWNAITWRRLFAIFSAFFSVRAVSFQASVATGMKSTSLHLAGILANALSARPAKPAPYCHSSAIRACSWLVHMWNFCFAIVVSPV